MLLHPYFAAAQGRDRGQRDAEHISVLGCKTQQMPHQKQDGSNPRSPPSVVFNTARVYLDTVLLMPPHRPLSEEMATATLLSTSAPAGAEPTLQYHTCKAVLCWALGQCLAGQGAQEHWRSCHCPVPQLGQC